MSDPDKKPPADGADAPKTNVTNQLEAAFEAAVEAVDAVHARHDAPVGEEGLTADETVPETAAAEPAATAARPAEAKPGGEGDPPVQPSAAGPAGVSGAAAAAMKAAEEWKARAYRATADLENTRKRNAREKEDLRKFAIEGLLKEILPVIDNLERAIGHAGDSEDPLAQGVRMVLKQFTTVVENQGVTPFEAQGEAFDPMVHEAMTQVETDEVPPGHVFQVFQRGWMIHDRLLRPAMVVVAAPKAPADTDEPVAQEATPADEG